ncbi:hypothetical protein ACA910_018807 [Epithemia clementina (nom. ined.)]
MAASTAEQLARQEHLIRKLTMDLKKEKEEAKKKDVVFRRYENFYRDVKAMSAQKAAQRKQQQQQQQPAPAPAPASSHQPQSSRSPSSTTTTPATGQSSSSSSQPRQGRSTAGHTNTAKDK